MVHRHAVPGGIALLVAACGLSVTGVDPVDAGALVEASAAPLIDSGFDAVAPASDATAADVAVDTGPLCDAPSLDCCGTGPCPAGTTECINGACFVSVDIAARIDGYDDLRLKGDTAQWQHLSFEEPTSLKLNNQGWLTDFPNNYDGDTCKSCFSSNTKTLAPPVAAHAQAGILDKFSGRGSVTLSPATADNGYTLVVHFADPDSSNASYTATVKYETR